MLLLLHCCPIFTITPPHPMQKIIITKTLQRLLILHVSILTGNSGDCAMTKHGGLILGGLNLKWSGFFGFWKDGWMRSAATLLFQTWAWSTLYPSQVKMQPPHHHCMWNCLAARPSLRIFNRNHDRKASLKAFIMCDQPPSAVTRVIQAAVMTLKGLPTRSQATGRGGQGRGAAGSQKFPTFPWTAAAHPRQEVDRTCFEK